MEQQKNNLQLIQERIQKQKELDLARRKELEGLETPEDSPLIHKKVVAYEMINAQQKIMKLSISAIIFNILLMLVYSYSDAPSYFTYIKIGVLAFFLFYTGYNIYTSKSKKQYLEQKYF